MSSGFKTVSIRVLGAKASKNIASKGIKFCKSKAAFCSEGQNVERIELQSG